MEEKRMKKIFAVLMAGAIFAASLTACSGGSAETTGETQAASEANGSGTESTDAGSGETTKLTVAASPTPHAEILNAAKDLLAEKGIELEVVEYTDYVQPNLVTDQGDVDANYFQHVAYLENFNEEQGTNLVSAGSIHYEPLGIYAGLSDDLSNIPDGAQIAVPNDTTNEARALLLLEANGVITLRDDAGLTATKMDIEDNPHNVEIIELEAAQVSRVASEVDFMVLNGNYALLGGLQVSDALAQETSDSETAQTYANVIAVREGDENREEIKTLVEVLKSDEIKQFINDNFEGAVVPMD